MRIILSFIFAINGFLLCLKKERNFIVEFVLAIMAILLGFILEIKPAEWIVIIFCITIVLCMEMLNTAIEQLCNLVHKDFHPAIGKIKDIAAGAVLLASVLSVVIACFIFLPKIISLTYG